MENASKALVIAGAILISILIIAIGMYIYSSSTDSIQEGISSMTTQQKEAFNANWTNYEGRLTGSQVKALINKLMSNANTYQEEAGKVITLVYNPGTANAYDATMPPTGTAYVPVTYTDTDADGTALNDYIDLMNDAYSAIQARHVYFIDLNTNAQTSLIDTIVVHYDRNP